MTANRAMVELQAFCRGYFNGKLVETGARFRFDTTPLVEGGPPRRLPKWALPVGDPRLMLAPPSVDIRPVATQAASLRKSNNTAAAMAEQRR